jgi:type I restriction enzyme S subunit
MIKQYEKYKPIKSSVYKEAPINWNKYRVKDTVDKNTYYPVGDGDHGSIKPEMYQEEGIPYIRVQNLTWHGEILTDGIVCISEDVQLANKKSNLYPGDILIAKTGATIGKLGLIPESIKEANTTSSVGKLTVDKKRFSPKYILYCFQSRALQDQIWLEASQKSAQPGFNIDDLIVFEFLAPDLDSQLKVVNYLDHQTAIIDQLILQKEKLIELLKEKRQAVINEAVTKGLNPNAKMKDSGIEWLGKVPEHWSVLSLNKVIEVKDGTHDTPNYVDPTEVDSYPLVTSKDFKNGEIDFSNAKYISQADHFEIIKRSNTEKGDILMSMIGGNIGNMVFVNVETEFSIKNVALFKTASNPVLGKFLFYILKSNLLQIQIDLKSRGGAQGFLALSDLRKLIFFKISVSEMVEINSYLDNSISKTESILNFLATQIEKLKEYRQSIISEAVTGKIDVRDWQPNKKQMA